MNQSQMMQRINEETGVTARREVMLFIGALLCLLGAIVLGHNTIYAQQPSLFGIIGHTPVLIVPIANLLIGSALLVAGATIINRAR